MNVVRIEIINRHYNDLLARRFGVNKTRELIAEKYDKPTIQAYVKTYVKSCDVYLVSMAVRHKAYGDLQLLLLLIH